MGGALTRMLGRGASIGGAHRYWRLRFPSGSNDANFVAAAEIEMRDTVGGTDRTTSICAASTQDVSFPATKAFDNTIGGANPGWFCSSGNSVNAWISNDLGSAYDIQEIRFYAYQTAVYSPTEIVVEYSDNNSTWTSDTRWPTMTGWGFDTLEIRDIRRIGSGVPTVYTYSGNIPGLNADTNSWSNFTLRNLVPAAQIPGQGGDRIKISLRSGNAEGLTISKAYIGIKGAGGTFHFASAPTQITFNGGSNSFTIAAATTQMSDPISLSFAATDDLVVSFYCPTGSGASDMFCRHGSGSAAFKAGDDASNQSPSGYTINGFFYLDDIEVWFN